MGGARHQGPQRPTDKEAAKKVRDALAAVRANRKMIGLDKHLSDAFDFLKVCKTKELWPVIEELLKELEDLGPAAHYAGSKPPQKSYEAKFQNDELWAYRWSSRITGRETYLKFILKKDWFFFVDCHEHKAQRN